MCIIAGHEWDYLDTGGDSLEIRQCQRCKQCQQFYTFDTDSHEWRSVTTNAAVVFINQRAIATKEAPVNYTLLIIGIASLLLNFAAFVMRLVIPGWQNVFWMGLELYCMIFSISVIMQSYKTRKGHL